jgi:hypothetical protein
MGMQFMTNGLLDLFPLLARSGGRHPDLNRTTGLKKSGVLSS